METAEYLECERRQIHVMCEKGKAITQITLSKELSAGEYPAILKISTAALDDGRAMNGANVETVLKVQ